MVDEALPPLPRFVEIEADEHWRCIDFISDLHLSEATPGSFAALERYLLSTPADAVFILGDLFEVWVGDDARHEGFEARCVELLATAASRLRLGFMHGNRDFLVGAELLSACGMQALADPTVLCAMGERVLLTHGDALCLEDLEYQSFRKQVRSVEWQTSFLGRTLAARRQIARDMREHSQARHRQRQARGASSDAPWADLDVAASVSWMHLAGAPTMIHGHTHRPATESLAPGHVRHVLSDWHLPPEETQSPRAEVLRWTPSGLRRINLVAESAAAPSARAG